MSNESPQDVFFDDVTVKHYTGALVQEQSYYPFGVQMAAISDKALKKANTPYKYNDGSELEEELNYYNTFYRKYDAQIGRFTGVDIRSEESFGMSVYNYGANNPVFFNDPLGDKYAYMDGNGNKWHGADPLRGTGGEGLQYNSGYGFDGFGDSGGGGGGGFGGGGGGGSLASRVDGGFMFRGGMAQQVFGALQTSYNNAGEGGAWSFTVGQNKNGDVGYWEPYFFADSKGKNGELPQVTLGRTFISLNNNSNGICENSFKFKTINVLSDGGGGWQVAAVNGIRMQIVDLETGEYVPINLPTIYFGLPIFRANGENYSSRYAAEIAALAVSNAEKKVMNLYHAEPIVGLDLPAMSLYFRQSINSQMLQFAGSATLNPGLGVSVVPTQANYGWGPFCF